LERRYESVRAKEACLVAFLKRYIISSTRRQDLKYSDELIKALMYLKLLGPAQWLPAAFLTWAT